MKLGRTLVYLLRKALAQPLYRKFARFEQACAHPEMIQRELLLRTLNYHRDTTFGRDHGFAGIKNVADYRRQLPVRRYEDLEPYIRRVMAGDTNALLADSKVLMFALTSGTTAARKHIPITKQYLDDYKRGWNLWGLQAIRRHPQIFFKPMLQLAGDADEYRTDADIPCGNLSGFTAQVQKRVMRRMYVLPPMTGKIRDAAARQYVALRFAAPKKLGMLVAANPSTLVNLARLMDREKENLIRDIADGTINPKWDITPELRQLLAVRLKPQPERAAELEAFANAAGGVLLPKDTWPKERLLIGCWTGGSVGPYLRQLGQYYGDTPVRDIGLLASEGRMTLPVEDSTPDGVLDITTHFFEFIPENEIDSANPTVLGAHEVREGGHYYILPTTKAGLYRYHISDLVRVTGFFQRTPLIEFLGKGSRFANLTGEKLSEYHVTQAVDIVARSVQQPLTSYALAPVWDDQLPYYGLYVEEQDAGDPARLRKFVHELDIVLGRQNIEYEAKRSSNRLGPIRIFLLPTGAWAKWDSERVRRTGGAVEQYKHPCLIGDLNFCQSVPVIRREILAAA
ncbi:GH3 auxin-responsive promoter family protein [Zavarzinella formosa]|uniref:GH3 auxin-responsive promoter family protein n=1 Tax=Zavarzinella formosa TaxID=360055 RepID=UPI00030A4927|nr:GH3 auxin-responsive promoter family protein [Zavarzinella formosa]